MIRAGTRSDEAARRAAADWAALIHDPDTPIDHAAFARWRADPRNAAAYAQIERSWDRAALVAQTSFARTRELPKKRVTIGAWLPRYALAAIAMSVAIAGMAIEGPKLFYSSGRNDAMQLASAVGEIRKAPLTDGSTVTLDTDTVLRVAFSAGERRLYLSRGRARFDVAHDAARPFIVIAGSGSVIARGTMFDVSVTDGRVRVTLLRGAVDVRNGARSQTPARSDVERLRAGQTLSFVASAPLPPASAASGDTQWTTGMLAFDGTRLSDAVAQANRYSAAKKIYVSDPAINDLRIDGAFHVGDTAGLANSLAETFNLRARTTEAGDVTLSVPRPAPSGK